MDQNMLQARWLAEVNLMRNTFPAFEPFMREGFFSRTIGFSGPLEGRHGKVYAIEISASAAGYPVQAPKIFIRPRVGSNWYFDGSLCVNRKWRPNQDTFTQQVLYAADYLKKHG